jgi:hypothetical protein
MFCDAYNKPIAEALAEGRELTAAMRQHLASCESCTRAYAQEQSFFAAIDSGLYSVANPEIPATLVPRVRVALNNESTLANRRFGFFSWSILGATTAIAVGLFLLSSRPRPVSFAPAPAPVVAASQDPAITAPLNSVRPGGVSRVQHGKAVRLVAAKYSRPEPPEVLVLPDEGVALRRYEESLQKKSARVIQTAEAKSLHLEQGIEPLRIAEIEFVDLKIPSLSNWQGDDDTK